MSDGGAVRAVIDAATARRRFLLLRGLRWLPTGLLIPILILLMLDRGLSLGAIGVAAAAQGLMVLLLELPTGGLADAIGRRPVLLVAAGFDIAAVGLLTVAASVPLLALVFALQGIYRALESGPLDAWYVDAAQAADPAADIERGLSAGGVVIGVALGAGSLVSGGLVALAPIPGIDPLVTPLLAALVLRAVEFGAVLTLMTEQGAPRGARALRQVTREVPAIVVSAVGTVRASTVLVTLVAIESLWGFGMVAFEIFTPAKLGAVMDSTDRAAALLGPTSTAAWLASAVGAGLVPLLVRRLGPALSNATLLLAQGAAVVGIALAAGPIGVVAAYVVTMTIHGAANPVHQGLLHREVLDPGQRATVLSANSMCAQTGGMIGGVGLGVLADATTLTTAMLVGAAVLGAAAALYLVVRRHGVAVTGVTVTGPDEAVEVAGA